ncbi:MAG: hypothetical protein U9R16_07190 [Campylobacterota bacterium]|nr:hypothetical protein [Campylobacterota bacterium]
MKNILILMVLLCSMLFASNDSKIDDNKTNEKQERIDNQIELEIQREKEYSKSNSFYIDLKGAEINEKSLKSLKEIEVDDLDMDSVYD